MLAIYLPLNVIQSITISVNAYKQKMIEIGNENEKIKNKDKWNYCHRMHILLFLGADNCLLVLHMAKLFIWIEETKESIN